jgi:hypothetical protein
MSLDVTDPVTATTNPGVGAITTPNDADVGDEDSSELAPESTCDIGALGWIICSVINTMDIA